MPSFKGTAKIIVQTNTSSVGYRFHFGTCSSASSNDGAIPYGLTIASATVTAKTNRDVVDTQLIAGTIVASPNIDVAISYPSVNGLGRYKLTFVLTFSDASRDEWDFDRVYVEDN